MKSTLTALLLTAATPFVFAQMNPAGLWKTIDDKTGTEKAQVRIVESGGIYSGKIDKLLAPDAKPDAVCDKCSDDRKDKPMVGLQIVRGVKKTGDDTFGDGTILDAAEGKEYKVRMQPADGGKKLEVRGYIGMPMLGRTQTWTRVE